ncbi:MAG: phospholipase Active site motif domain protein [Phycisphaerales bacterium]|nr:phospholipase Active site motif domain protein [Phycisphaerales bacterium]
MKPTALTVLAPPPPSALAGPAAPPAGGCELVVDAQHFERVVLAGILRAKVSLDIMTADFKAMLVPERGRSRARSIVEVMRALAARGVEVRLLHAGTPSAPALQELKRSLPEHMTIRRCPRLHSKAVVIDCQRMYLGSANLTGAGLGAKGDTRRNFEMGVWTEAPAMIDAVLDEFNALWEGRQCDGCGRKDHCPVPLEEPDLV